MLNNVKILFSEFVAEPKGATFAHENKRKVMKEEMLKFEKSLATARENIQMGMIAEAESKEDMQFLIEVQNELAKLQKKIRDYCR